MRSIVVGVLLLASTVAFADENPAPAPLSPPANALPQSGPAPTEQALSQRLLQEINLGLQCNVNLIDLQRKNTALENELKALKESKADPKK